MCYLTNNVSFIPQLSNIEVLQNSTLFTSFLFTSFIQFLKNFNFINENWLLLTLLLISDMTIFVFEQLEVDVYINFEKYIALR